MRLEIQGGRVQDPVHGIDGEIRTITVDDGRVVPHDPARPPEKVIDASGLVVLPGAVDLHTHVAGPCVNRARRLMQRAPSSSRQASASGSQPAAPVPSTRRTGQLYAGLGYTTIVEAAVPPAGAHQCHLELADVPCVDKGFLLLLSEHPLVLELLRQGEKAAARNVVASLLGRAGAFGIKAVNPGAPSPWETTALQPGSLEKPCARHGVSPRAILEFLGAAAEELELPHPVHVHGNHLGMPGNIETTLETSRILQPYRHHLAHAQFHAYGEDGRGGYASAAGRLAEHFNRSRNLSLDVGPVMFGETVTVSADAQLEHTLWQLTRERYVSIGSEMESCCGILPWRYSTGSPVHALQWAVGLELLLLAEDPWRVALSTDHPNAASFLALPAIMALLMDSALRRERLESLPLPAPSRCVLQDLTREYTLQEITIITRAAPARLLGLERKGHLGVGADADIALYAESPDRERMFRFPVCVLKAGEVLLHRGTFERTTEGRVFRVSPAEQYKEKELRRWFEKHGTIRLEQLGPDPERLREMPVVRRQRGEVSSP